MSKTCWRYDEKCKKELIELVNRRYKKQIEYLNKEGEKIPFSCSWGILFNESKISRSGAKACYAVAWFQYPLPHLHRYEASFSCAGGVWKFDGDDFPDIY